MTKKISILAASALVLLSGAIFAFHDGRGEGSEKSLAVVTYNVGTLHGEKPRLEAVVGAIAKKGVPDLVLLEEVPDDAFAVGIARSLALPFHVFKAYRANGVGYGLAILAARHLSNPELHDLKRCGHAALFAEMEYGDKRLRVCSLHLERVKSLKQDKEGFQMSWGEAARLLRSELTEETPRRRDRGTEVRCQRSDVRDQMSEGRDRGPMSEVGGLRSDVRGTKRRRG